MAIKIIGKIVLFEAITQDLLDSYVAGSDTVVLQLEQNFTNGPVLDTNSLVIDSELTGFATDYFQALKDILDRSVFKFFENSVFFNVIFDVGTKAFDLSGSFVRVDVDSTVSQGSVITGQLLKAMFITPGLEGPVYTEIDLPFNDVISVGDYTKMTNIGLDLNLGGTGDVFSIKTQLVPFKVIFFKPDVVLENYVINFNKNNETIEI